LRSSGRCTAGARRRTSSSGGCRTARRFAASVGPGVGMLVDSWHWRHGGGTTTEDRPRRRPDPACASGRCATSRPKPSAIRSASCPDTGGTSSSSRCARRHGLSRANQPPDPRRVASVVGSHRERERRAHRCRARPGRKIRCPSDEPAALRYGARSTDAITAVLSAARLIIGSIGPRRLGHLGGCSRKRAPSSGGRRHREHVDPGLSGQNSLQT
jgi:hypothetical protein